jgi:hypothetical protein
MKIISKINTKIYLFSGEDLVVSRRSLLLRDFDDDTTEVRSFESLLLLVFSSDLSLYFRFDNSSLEEVVAALRRISDLKLDEKDIDKNDFSYFTNRLLVDRLSFPLLLLDVIFLSLLSFVLSLG